MREFKKGIKMFFLIITSIVVITGYSYWGVISIKWFDNQFAHNIQNAILGIGGICIWSAGLAFICIFFMSKMSK